MIIYSGDYTLWRKEYSDILSVLEHTVIPGDSKHLYISPLEWELKCAT